MSETVANKQYLTGIGGWLILVVIGVILKPLLIFSQLINNYIPILKELDEFSEMFVQALIIEVSVNTIFLFFSIYLLYLFFSKNYKTPKLFISFHVLYFAFIVLDILAVSFLFDLEVDSDDIKDIVRQLIFCMIWIPYFLVSVRVKNTFVLGKKEAVIKPQDMSIVR